MKISDNKYAALLFWGLVLINFQPAIAQETYFYHGYGYGSEAVYNPVTLVLNGGYGILAFDGHSRDILHFPYREASRNVWNNLSNPLGPIQRYGWGNFIDHELLPLSLNKKGAQWLPNYKLHLIGGGMTYRMTSEWYQIHGLPHPRALSIVTMGAYHYLNEVAENGPYQGDNVDPIADIYFFDVGGIILFSFDGVSRFFSHYLNLSDWSSLASFDIGDFNIQNHGQNFSVRWQTPFSEKWRLFYYFGNVGLSGLSYHLSDDRSLSLGLGVRARQQVVIDERTHRQTVDLVWNSGLFYDRNNSLLVSFQLSGMESRLANLNIYPGLAQIGRISPGIWFNVSKHGDIMFGLTTTWTPGIAIK